MKRFFSFVVALCAVFLCACTPAAPSEPTTTAPSEPTTTAPAESTTPSVTEAKIAVPDVTETEEAIAKTVLTNNGLVPKVEYEYSDTVAAGTVIRTQPVAGEQVEPNTKITLYVSLGPSKIYCKNAIINWYYAKDEWQLYKPYLEDGYLYIDCDVAFADDMKWADYATAALDLSFSQSVPVTVYYENKSCSAYQTQQVLFKVPVSGLGEERPSSLYLRMYMIIDGKEIYADIDLSIEW